MSKTLDNTYALKFLLERLQEMDLTALVATVSFLWLNFNFDEPVLIVRSEDMPYH